MSEIVFCFHVNFGIVESLFAIQQSLNVIVRRRFDVTYVRKFAAILRVDLNCELSRLTVVDHAIENKSR